MGKKKGKGKKKEAAGKNNEKKEGQLPAEKELPEEEKATGKGLYVFFLHDRGCKYLYSLYKIQTPHDTTPVNTTIPTTTTTIVTETGTGIESTTTTVAYGDKVPERVWINPILRFRSSDWPGIMSCAILDSKLYFFGGHTGCGEDMKYPSQVFIYDPSFPSPYPDKMARGPDMNTGKISPMVSFTADGKIFVLSGRSKCFYTGAKLTQFEILTPTEDGSKWIPGKKPPFWNAIDIQYAIVHRTVIILASSAKTNYSTRYDLDCGTWKPFDTSCWTKPNPRGFSFTSGSPFIGETLYSMHVHAKTGLPVVIALKDHVDKKEGGFLLDDKGIFQVVRHKIESPEPSYTLTRVGDRRMCFIHAGAPLAPSGDPDHFNHDEYYMSVTLFHILEEGQAEHINSAHYVMKPNGLPFHVLGAYAV